MGEGEGVPAAMPQQEELEIKLRLEPEHAARLERSDVLRALVQGRVRCRRLMTTYFDTADLALSRRGASLRVRDDGSRHTQTVKVPASGADGRLLCARKEFETEVAGAAPDIDRLQPSAVRALAAAKALKAPFRPVFSTRVNRRILPVRVGDSDIEVAIDVGEVVCGDRHLPIHEAELELKSGSPQRLYELALDLHRSMPLRLEPRTKAARGYALAAGATARPEKAASLHLGKTMTLEQAVPLLIRNGIGHLLANEAVVLEVEDPEGVHQMRIALRRLRALLTLFRPVITPDFHDYLRDELRFLRDALGPARDWDVFLGETIAPLAARLGFPASLDLLAERAELARKEAYARARAAVADPRFTALALRTDLWLEGSLWPDRSEGAAMLESAVTDFAAEALDAARSRVMALGRKHESLSEAKLHKLRIRMKKLRYLSEFFSTLYGKKRSARYVRALREVQDALGSINDAVAGRTLLDAIDSDKGGGAQGAAVGAGEATALVHGWFIGRIASDRRHFADHWRAFKALHPFWIRA